MPVTGRALPTGTAQQPRNMAGSQAEQVRLAASPVVTAVTVEARAGSREALTGPAEERPQRQAVRAALSGPVQEKARRLAAREALTGPVEEKPLRPEARAPEGAKAPLAVRVTEGSNEVRANADR